MPESLNEIPDGLGAMQYAMRICEDLGIPSRSNVQMIGEAIEAVSKSKLFRGRDDAVKVSYYWLSRRVMTAKDQGTKINSLFFHNGEYWNVEKPSGERKSPKYCGQCESGWLIKDKPFEHYKSKRARVAYPCMCRTNQS